MFSTTLIVKTAEEQTLLAYGIKLADAPADLPSVLRRAGAGALSAALPGAIAGGGLAYITADPDEQRMGRRVAKGALIGGGVAAAANAVRHGVGQRLRNVAAEDFFKSQTDALKAQLPSVREAASDAYAKNLSKIQRQEQRFADDLVDIAARHVDPDIRSVPADRYREMARGAFDFDRQAALQQFGRAESDFMSRGTAAATDKMRRMAAPEETYAERAYGTLRKLLPRR